MENVTYPANDATYIIFGKYERSVANRAFVQYANILHEQWQDIKDCEFIPETDKAQFREEMRVLEHLAEKVANPIETAFAGGFRQPGNIPGSLTIHV